MRYAAISALILCALAAQALPQAPAPAQPATPNRKIPCKTPDNAATCYWTHGRLSVYNGDPSWRLWKIGTSRILGIFSGPSHFPPRTDQDMEDPELPENLNRIYALSYRQRRAANDFWLALPDRAFGDFEICPLEPERKGEMQAACIEATKNIVLQPFPPSN
jgi:hypothetical protein